MSYSCTSLGPLADQFPVGSLFRAWLEDRPPLESRGAGPELAAALAAPAPREKAPLWRADAFGCLLPERWRNLPQGPSVVVTGQQPGFLGGPLLTLYKIATAIALARQRTAAGQPTVPVFWSGDDDDDLAEALAPVGWDRTEGRLLRSPDQDLLRAPATQRAILAELEPARWAAPARDHLRASVTDDGLVADLITQLIAAVTDERAWGPAHGEMLARIFAGSDLVVIRGHDRQLHESAAPFYLGLQDRLAELAALARARGGALREAGFHAQISDRSLDRPLFRVQQGRRVVATDADLSLASQLRPGVMLRSPLQDWLLRPAAVVVGPGELAYLRQLDPLYAALDLGRSALVPRLSSWVLPNGPSATEMLALIRPLAPVTARDPTEQAESWADQIIEPTKERLARLLARELDLSVERSSSLADNRARRFRKGLVSMFKGELARQNLEGSGMAPAWVLPDGQRQERSLGLLSALGLWGQDLVAAILDAAEQHLQSGQRGAWSELAITVPEGTVSK